MVHSVLIHVLQKPKQLKYDYASSSVCNADDDVATITLNPPAKKTDMDKCTPPPLVNTAGYLVNELLRLTGKQSTTIYLLQNKKEG
ncbi:hypothetical protein KP79_PYT21323 [Mizuhopecten yessoensis]|uniref:Uncharacterized protein n=1 Tax=Mizuhopecten yessoensis TaxID=6573 RepID=A0A210PL00_MIZYE|nr:hypothetical protein KP79_PYT21323 [Mizuhopecten yessoensis]